MNRIKVPFVNLGKQYETIQHEINTQMETVLRKGEYILGENVLKFEQALAELCGAKYSAGVGSGTDALVLSLLAIGLQSGDQVITTPFSFAATTNAIIRVGAIPVFVDIEKTTFNIDISQITKYITSKTKAVLPVHLFGQTCNLDELSTLTQKNNLYLIEDAAQSIGAKHKKRVAGSVGDAGAFSFYPTKNLGAYGDAGAVVTNREDVIEFIKTFRAQGARRKGLNEAVGMNSRLDEIQATVLLTKLKYLDNWIHKRREVARIYDTLLEDTPVTCPHVDYDRLHTFYQYTILVPYGRDQLVNFLYKHGVEVKIYYQLPLFSQPAYQHLGFEPESFPVCQYVCRHVLSLPCYPELSRKDQEFIANKIKSFFYQYRPSTKHQ